MMQRLVVLATAALMAALMMGASSCKQQVIDKATFKLADDQKSAKLTLVFAPNIQPIMMGVFPINEYGTLFINPYQSAEKPFEVGFDLNLNIVHDPVFLNMERTDSLPNGVPLGIGYPVVEIKPANGDTAAFNMYGYVDVDHLKWLGAAAMFKFMSDKNFPAGMAITNIFALDDNKKPAIIGHVFGALVDNNGNLIRNGGIAVMANVRYLVDSNIGRADGEEVVYKPIRQHK